MNVGKNDELIRKLEFGRGPEMMPPRSLGAEARCVRLIPDVSGAVT